MKEVVDERQFEDGTSKQVYFTRYATFGIGGSSYRWADFKRVDNLQEIMDKLANHTHEWSKITGKPTVYPPSSHTHDWADIENIEQVQEATQAEVESGFGTDKYISPRRLQERELILLSGQVRADGTRISYAREWFSSTRLGKGRYKITHNLGTVNYGLVGAGLTIGTLKVGIHERKADYCIVDASDDSSNNDGDFSFMIFRV